MDAGGCGDFADTARIFLKVVRRVKGLASRDSRSGFQKWDMVWRSSDADMHTHLWGRADNRLFCASFDPKSDVYRSHSLQSIALHIKAWQRLSALYFGPRGKLRRGIFRKLAIRERGAEGWWGFGRGCARGSVVLARGSGLPFGRGGSGF